VGGAVGCVVGGVEFRGVGDGVLGGIVGVAVAPLELAGIADVPAARAVDGAPPRDEDATGDAVGGAGDCDAEASGVEEACVAPDGEPPSRMTWKPASARATASGGPSST
jgi:hypothetical protein